MSGNALSYRLVCMFALSNLIACRSTSRPPRPTTVCCAGGYDVRIDGTTSADQIGSPLQPADLSLLQLKPLRRYMAGEVVAYQCTALAPGSSGTGPSDAAAYAAEQRWAASTAAASAQSGGAGSTAAAAAAGYDPVGHSMRYGCVALDGGPEDGHPVYKLSVEVRPNVVHELLSTQIYCFRAAGAGGEGRVSAYGGSGAGWGVQTPAPEESLMFGGASTAAAVAAAAAAPSYAGGDPPARQQSRVRSDELVGAVRGILSAAGLPLTLAQVGATVMIFKLLIMCIMPVSGCNYDVKVHLEFLWTDPHY